MSDLNALELYAKLCGFKLLVLANRFGSTNAVSDHVHHEFLERIGDLIELMQDILHAERKLRVVSDAVQREEVEWARWSCEHHLVDVYLTGAPYPLLEFVPIDPETQEYRDNTTGSWRPLTEDGPYLRDVSNEELSGLRTIMDQIAEETGICFSAYRVVWGSQPDEEAEGATRD
ncbi:hypothetical protein J2046_006565 [Rhizobium petrolearium]|uniref:Uncharacterized protein n=2 Tax=Neorhizobium TaxID=1525371 RepID=A0ABV0MC76_9HYPH|nr:hypothetical protein [Neorhizobium petrolearium]MBP1848274.1 hypothetical protein [Neorhizobium petrolearium]MCC2614429.1 hypothetical protein [Neorhizobium petrolearium]WGI72526.1 hypothetical protein QEO92_32050 [Neorhizobium petrolearium]